MKQIKWFRNMFLICASAIVLFGIASCSQIANAKAKEAQRKAEEEKKKAEEAVEYEVMWEVSKKIGDVEMKITDAEFKKLKITAKKDGKEVTSGTKFKKNDKITFEFSGAADCLDFDRWVGVTKNADKKMAELTISGTSGKVVTVQALLKKVLLLKEIKLGDKPVKDGKVSVASSKDEVKAVDFVAKFSYYDKAGALKTDKIIDIDTVSYHTLFAGIEEEVTLKVNADTYTGSPAWEGKVKVLRKQVVDVTDMTLNLNNIYNVDQAVTGLEWKSYKSAVTAELHVLENGAKITKVGDVKIERANIVDSTSLGMHMLSSAISNVSRIKIKKISATVGGSLKTITATTSGNTDDILISNTAATDVTIQFEEDDKYEVNKVVLNLKTR